MREVFQKKLVLLTTAFVSLTPMLSYSVCVMRDSARFPQGANYKLNGMIHALPALPAHQNALMRFCTRFATQKNCEARDHFNTFDARKRGDIAPMTIEALPNFVCRWDGAPQRDEHFGVPGPSDKHL